MKLDGRLGAIEHDGDRLDMWRRRPPAAGRRARGGARPLRDRVRRQHPRHGRRRRADERQRLRRGACGACSSGSRSARRTGVDAPRARRSSASSTGAPTWARARSSRAHRSRSSRATRDGEGHARGHARPPPRGAAVGHQDLRLDLQEPRRRAPRRTAGQLLEAAGCKGLEVGRRAFSAPSTRTSSRTTAIRDHRRRGRADRRGPPPRAGALRHRARAGGAAARRRRASDPRSPRDDARRHAHAGRMRDVRPASRSRRAFAVGVRRAGARRARLARVDVAARLVAGAGGAGARSAGLTTRDAPAIRRTLRQAAMRMTTLHYSEEELQRAVEPFPAVRSVSVDADLPAQAGDQRARAPARGRARRPATPGASRSRATGRCCPHERDVPAARGEGRRDSRRRPAGRGAEARLVRVLARAPEELRPLLVRAYRGRRRGAGRARRRARRCASALRCGWPRSGPPPRACWRTPRPRARESSTSASPSARRRPTARGDSGRGRP